VICAFTAERWQAIAAALESVASQTAPADRVVLVIDHNPDLLTRARERWPDVAVIENAGVQGLSDARNSGVAACGGDIVAFLDDDAVAPRDWLERLTARYDNPDVIAVGGAVRPHWLSRRPRWFPAEFDWVVGCSHSGMPKELAPVRNLIGAGMSFRRSVLTETGGFRSELGRVGTRPVGCEETEMCIRARERWPDAVVLYDPSAVVDHDVPDARATLHYFLARCWFEGRSKSVLARLAGQGDALSSERTYTSQTLPAGVRRGLRDSARGDLAGAARATMIVVGLLATTAGYGFETVARFGRRQRRHASPTAQRRDSKAPLRVLMVTPRYPPETGGVERHVYEVSRRLRAMHCDVTVLCTDRTGTMPRSEEREGVRIRRVRAWPSNRDYYFAPGLWRAMNDGTWDVVHVQSYHTLVAPLAMLRARRLGIPFVMTFHGGGHSSKARHSLRPLQRRLLGPLVRGAARLVAIARFEVPLYTQDFGVPADRFAFIPNGTDVRANAVSSPPSSDGAVIASVGRLERYKGHHRVLAALPYVLQQRPDVSLWIVGTGPDEESLRQQARDLGVTDRVQFRSVPSDDADGMRSLLLATSLVVSMSDFETQPLAALEALAAGRSLLVADTSGLRELAEDGYARSIPLDSTTAQVANAIVGELDADRTAPTLSTTTWDECTADLLALYEEVACAS
jgi:glycosyltransferase involved in cell wall biosynthesis